MKSSILSKVQLTEKQLSDLKGILLGKEKFFKQSQVKLFFIHKKSKATITLINNNKQYKHLSKEYYKGTLNTSEWRPILAPDKRRKTFLKLFLKWCEENLENEIEEVAQGFRKRKNIKTNALKHVENNYALQIDLKDFFNQFDYNFMRNYFKSLGIPNDWSRLIAELCCFNGSMFQGSPVSPFLANLFVKQMDRNINGYCKTKGYVYTRYADDITITSKEPIPKKVKFIILRLINKYGCKPNMKKVYFQSNILNVTGISIVNNKLYMPRKLKKNLKYLSKSRNYEEMTRRTKVYNAHGKEFEVERKPSWEEMNSYITKKGNRLYFVVKGLKAYKFLCEKWELKDKVSEEKELMFDNLSISHTKEKHSKPPLVKRDSECLSIH